MAISGHFARVATGGMALELSANSDEGEPGGGIESGGGRGGQREISGGCRGLYAGLSALFAILLAYHISHLFAAFSSSLSRIKWRIGAIIGIYRISDHAAKALAVASGASIIASSRASRFAAHR